MISPHTNLFSKSVLSRTQAKDGAVSNAMQDILVDERQRSILYTHWMTPAACGALVPFRMVQARTSSGPAVKYRMRSRPSYPAFVILPSAPVTLSPNVLSSSASASGEPRARRRSSRATEKGINKSPGLFLSIHSLIFGNLDIGKSTSSAEGSSGAEEMHADSPLVLFPHVIPLAQVHKVDDRFGGQKLH